MRSGATWLQQSKLAGQQANGWLGTSVALSGDTLIAGAPNTWNDGPGSALVFVRSGTTWNWQQSLSGASGALDEFGSRASVSSDTAVVGAPQDSTSGGAYAGSAYVFVRSGAVWAQQQRLMPSGAQANDHFGSSVALSADTVVVGEPVSSRAYVFVRSATAWTEQQVLAPSDPPQYLFGLSVAVDGATAFVGAPFGLPDGAYAFVRSGTSWSEQQKVRSTDPAGGDYLFGDSVSISGDTLAFGAAKYPSAILYPHRVYVFERTGTIWTLRQTLSGSDTADEDGFGDAVALDADTLVVGAPGKDGPAGPDSGAAYVFVRQGPLWAEQQKLTASDEAALLGLGSKVGLSGDTVVLGSRGGLDPGTAGTAYVFARSGTTWSEQQKLMASDASGGDGFGSSVSVSGESLVVGALLADTPSGADTGAAYVFVRSGTAWSEQQKLFASVPGDGHLGRSVSLAGETLLAGDPYWDGSMGAAYVFVRSGTAWNEQQRLVPTLGPDPSPGWFGLDVSVSADVAVVGAPYAGSFPAISTGAAYVFLRSGTTWAQSQALLAEVPRYDDSFGGAVSMWGDTIAVGAPGDDIPYNADAGSVYSFRQFSADLAISKTDGQTEAVPGTPLTYTISTSNAGPFGTGGVAVVDPLPARLSGATWTCSASPGSSCTPTGAGGIDDTATLLVGGTATYTLTAILDATATGTLANTATISMPPGGTDPDVGNNSATDTDTLTPVADLAVTKSDGQTSAAPGQVVSYTITATNAGPSAAAGALVADVVPAALQGATWTCSASPGSSCTASGSGSISDTVTALVGGGLTYTLTGTVDPAATGALANTASVAPAAGASDPAMANNAATDVDALPVGFPTDGELLNGYDQRHDLAALPGPVADEDVFRIYQQPHASYEVVVDGVSGDLGVGSGPLVERLASDASTVLQSSSPAGAGGSRSLRWMNPLDYPVAEEFVRVRSAGCTTDCDTADVYRLRARETTGFIPRFNNSATQVTVLVLENAGDAALDVDVRFWSQTGAPLGGTVASLGPRQSYVLNTSTIAPGAGGSITVANTGTLGQLAGKSVAVEPATGFTFDTALVLRPR